MPDSDLLSKHLPMVYRTAWMLTGNEADAEDLAHDTMVSALTSLGRFRGESKLSTWLTAILINRHRTWKRSREVRSRVRPDLRESSAPPDEVQRGEEEAAVRRALERLDDDQRTLVALSVYQGLDSTEIGRILGRPPGTVRWKLHEAREKLKSLFLEKR